MKTTTLYRPVGLRELELIAATGWQAFPPRLEWQPIFYPVTNQPYAEQIARDWNTQDAFSGYCGIVTRFAVDALFCARYAVQQVGDSQHTELWVPAEDLPVFNAHIAGRIEVVSAFFGASFELPAASEVAALLHTFQTV